MTRAELWRLANRLNQTLQLGGQLNPDASLQPVSLVRYITAALDERTHRMSAEDFREYVGAETDRPPE